MAPVSRRDEERAPRFIADCHLGKLAKYLRFMGYDTLYFSHIDDGELLELARNEKRTVLTRDAALAGRKGVPVFLLSPLDTAAQLHLLGEAFGLRLHGDDSRRCLVCNAPLERIGKETLGDNVPEAVRKRFDFFQRCAVCGRIYWHGDHYRRMHAFIGCALGDAGIMRHD